MQPSSEFFHLVNNLKGVRRAGWVQRGVEDAESVADHSYGVAMFVLLLASHSEVDRERCLAMAIVHDLAETLTGDITPTDGIPADEKQQAERGAINQLARLAGDEQFTAVWEEYCQGLTPEAQLVHEADALEMASQAISYKRLGKLSAEHAQVFLTSAGSRLQSAAARRIFAGLQGE
jgi:5'-deoxynucleotidase